MQKILAGLNAAQRAAVTSSASVLQVLAPPGSGKTKTLTSRVAYLLAHEQYAPWNVICCTFTIKASREMRERLRGMIGDELQSKLILGTFHSVCRRYLVRYGHLIGIPRNFGIADSDDSLKIVKRAVKRLKLSIDPKTARSKISHRKAKGERLEDVLRTTSKSINAQEFVTIFQEYEDALALSNLLDYDDLLMRCVELLKQHPECVSNVEALLIDEFQDTNVVQFELMKLLASAKRRVTIVGDPDQSIYGFRSAEIENLRRMKAYYPETITINLEENYRSVSAVLNLAQEVIEQDSDRPQKKLRSTHRYGTLPVLRRLPNPHEEAQWIVSEIKRMMAMTGQLIQYGDIAILLRSAYLSLLIEKALANVGIPYRMVGGRRFFDRVEVRVILDYLRTISHPDNNSALLAIINTPARKIGDTSVAELVKLAEQKNETLWTVVNKVLKGQHVLDKKLAKPAEQGLTDLVSLITMARKKMDNMKAADAPGKLIEHVVTCLGYQNYLKKQYPEDHEERWENVRELVTQATDSSLQFNVPDAELPTIDGVVQQGENGPQEVLCQFLANVVLSTEVESDEEGVQKSRVTISTIHSAKGLEWPVVLIPAVYEGSLPHSRAEDTNEERRLLYVAMTRAQALLYMTFPVMQSRDYNESILSQFLPSGITPFVSQTGPVFSDRVIEDIASALRRPGPSQAEIAQGHLSIKEHESQLDDIWPEDGTPKRSFNRSDTDPVSFVLQKGQSLSDALGGSRLPGQRAGYSTLAQVRHSETQMLSTLDGPFSMSNTTIGFTTANQHLKTIPQSVSQEKPKPVLIKSASEGVGQLAKKPKLVKSVSGQGTLTSFLGGGTSKSISIPVAKQAYEAVKRDSIGAELPASPREVKPEPSIPQALSAHRLALGSSLFNKPRIRTSAVQETPPDAKGKRTHAFLSNSPTKEQHDVQIEDANNTRGPRLTSFKDTNHISVATHTFNTTGRFNNATSLAGQNSFHSGQLNRLNGLNPLDNMTGTMTGDAVTQSRKTLGVRRSMNGWDNRKYK